ncbi:uncharacterized protein LOC143912724 isoform X3 [Arctopsyche grandis]
MDAARCTTAPTLSGARARPTGFSLMTVSTTTFNSNIKRSFSQIEQLIVSRLKSVSAHYQNVVTYTDSMKRFQTLSIIA